MNSELIIIGSQQYLLWQPGVDVFLDQLQIGQISLRDSMSFAILPGKHNLYLKYNSLGLWRRSNTILFRVSSGESITVNFSYNRWAGEPVIKVLNTHKITNEHNFQRTTVQVNMSETFNNDFSNSNIANLANKVTDYARQQANQNIYTSEQKHTLSEAAAEIQKLLKQLEKTNPTATDSEKVVYINDETTPSFKRRVACALQSGGEAAIEEFLNNPYVNVGKAIVKGWIRPE